MKTIIQSPNFKPSDDLLSFAKKNIEKLDSIGSKILEGRMLLKTDKSSDRENKVCELKLIIPGNDLFASKNSQTFEEAIAKTIEAMKHQLTRWKESTERLHSLS